MSRIFRVGPSGAIVIMKANPKELLKENKDLLLLEVREEEAEFLKEVRGYDWFQDALKRLDLTEEAWLENSIKAQMAFIERATFCPYCRTLFEEEIEAKAEKICFSCAKRVLDIIKGSKYG